MQTTHSDRRIGDLELFPIGLGCMGYSAGTFLADPKPGYEAVAAGLDAGIRLLDSARIYAPSWDAVGHNERFVAASVAHWRARAQVDGATAESASATGGAPIIVTKGGIVRGPGETWGRDGSAAGLLAGARASAEALGLRSDDGSTGAIDLYLLHRLDPDVHFTEQIHGLIAVHEAGLAARIGLSNVTAAQLERALELGAPIVAVQNEFSLRYRADAEVIELCAERGIAFMPWSPLGGASLKGDVSQRYGVVGEIARARGVTPQTVVLAWLLGYSACVLPIPGATRRENVLASARAADLVLDRAEVEAVSATVPEHVSVFPDDLPAPQM